MPGPLIEHAYIESLVRSCSHGRVCHAPAFGADWPKAGA